MIGFEDVVVVLWGCLLFVVFFIILRGFGDLRLLLVEWVVGVVRGVFGGRGIGWWGGCGDRGVVGMLLGVFFGDKGGEVIFFIFIGCGFVGRLVLVMGGVVSFWLIVLLLYIIVLREVVFIFGCCVVGMFIGFWGNFLFGEFGLFDLFFFEVFWVFVFMKVWILCILLFFVCVFFWLCFFVKILLILRRLL